MAEKDFHSPDLVAFKSLRSGLWLVLDLLDDMLEADIDPVFIEQLRALRGEVVDVLFGTRSLENQLLRLGLPLSSE